MHKVADSWAKRCLVMVALAGLVTATAAVSSALGHAAGAATGPPVITLVSPPTGSTYGSQQVRIDGQGFWCGTGSAPSTATVTFGTTPVTLASHTANGGPPSISLFQDGEILVNAPPAATAGWIDITVTVPCGTSAKVSADRYAYVGPCVTWCTIIAWPWPAGGATPKIGALSGVAGGWTTPIAATKEASYLDNLNLSAWRTGGSASTNQLSGLLQHPPNIELDIADGFEAVTGNARPWADGYKTWDAYLTAMNAGQDFILNGKLAQRPPGPVTYWDVWNEPINFGYFSPEGSATDYYNLFAHTYLELQSLGAAGKVVIPSVESFIDYSLPASGTLNSSNFISMKNLLDWIEAYNQSQPASGQLHFGAYSFHVINSGGTCYETTATATSGCPGYALNSPTAVADAVRRMRNLLQQYPDLEPAEIQVNEYATGNHTHANTNNSFKPWDPGTTELPGWQAGYIAAFEDAGVNQANLSCWSVHYGVLNLNAYQQCAKNMDGLFSDGNTSTTATDGALQPLPTYYVLQFYGHMTGNKLVTTSSSSDVSAYVTQDDASKTMKMLVGRAARCSVDTSRDPICPGGGAAAAVSIAAAWPYGGSQVKFQVQVIPNTNGNPGMLAAPQTGTLPVKNGLISLTIPGVQDAFAYTVTISPS